MVKTALIICAALIVPAVFVSASAEDRAIPDFASTTFGWLNTSGFDFLLIEGKVAPIGPDPSWHGGVGLPPADFNYQPPKPGRNEGEHVDGDKGPWIVERLGDAENPNLTPWAAAQVRMHNDLVRHGRRAFSAMSRCWPGGGPPGQLLFFAEPLYFIQTPEEVWILWQRDHLVRRIFLNRGHSENRKPSWFGKSVGHYENGELVVDTIGIAERQYSFVDNYRTPHTKELHTVERWKVLAGGKEIEATITIEDAGAFKKPWSGLVRWAKFNRPMGETACHENNENYEQFLHISEYPMPEAKTSDF